MIIMMLNIEARINNESILQEYGSQLLSKAVEHFYISMFALLLAIVVAVL